MDKYAIYEAWAPAASVWSPWVKPVPFAHLPHPPLELAGIVRPQFDLAWLQPGKVRCAIVADLPGTAAFYFALQAAAIGWQPVSLLNACPPPYLPSEPGPVESAVDVDSLLNVLVTSAPELTACPPPPDAPPVFVLDAQRQAPGRLIDEEMFDNRSVVFASDLPSARTLAAHGINRVFVVREAAIPPGRDLAHALAPWQKAGVEINLVTADGSSIANQLPRTGPLAEMWFRFTTWFSLRRNPSGGFGAFVPESSGG